MSDWLLVKADYSQIELRIMAVVSGDKNMLGAYQRGEDIHTKTASLINNISFDAVTQKMRDNAKPLNFGLSYDMSAASFVDYAYVEYGVEYTLPQAKKFKKMFTREAYPGIGRYHDKIKAETLEAVWNGRFYKAVGLTGRVRWFAPTAIPMYKRSSDEDLPDDEMESYYTICKDVINYKMQNGNAEGMKRAEIVVGREVKRRKLAAKSILQVHDEKVYEVHKKHLTEFLPVLYTGMKRSAEYVVQNKVPIEIEINVGKNWSDMRRVK